MQSIRNDSHGECFSTLVLFHLDSDSRHPTAITDGEYATAAVHIHPRLRQCTTQSGAPSQRRRAPRLKGHSYAGSVAGLDSCRDEFLSAFALNIAEVDRAVGSDVHTMNPVQVAGFLFAVFALREDGQ